MSHFKRGCLEKAIKISKYSPRNFIGRDDFWRWGAHEKIILFYCLRNDSGKCTGDGSVFTNLCLKISSNRGFKCVQMLFYPNSGGSLEKWRLQCQKQLLNGKSVFKGGVQVVPSVLAWAGHRLSSYRAGFPRKDTHKETFFPCAEGAAVCLGSFIHSMTSLLRICWMNFTPRISLKEF